MLMFTFQKFGTDFGGLIWKIILNRDSTEIVYY